MSEFVSCNLCGSNHYAVVYHGEVAPDEAVLSYKITDHGQTALVRVVRCLKCGLIYVNPRPTANPIYESYIQSMDNEYVQEEAGRRAAARVILDYLDSQRKSGRLLDIGCGVGFLLDEARKANWQVSGVELSQWAVDYAKNKLGLEDIRLGLLKDANFPDNHFDAVILKDVIEHLPNPKQTLEEIRRILKPTGVICCNTPDINSWISRFLGAKWWGIKQHHLYYFHKESLSKMLQVAGFVPTKVRWHARTFSLAYWVKNFAYYKPWGKSLWTWLNKHPALGQKLISIDLGDQIEVFARRSRRLEYLQELEHEPAKIEKKKRKVVVVLPAYNAANTLAQTVADIPRDVVDDIILVDDCSKDNTVEVAKSLGLKVFVHEKNKGYGGNQKTCYTKALEMGADVAVMVHPDYQYDPKAIKDLVEPILEGKADAVFGSRMMKGGALEGGMPLWKHNANIALTALENVFLGIYLTEYHSGFRAYSSRYLRNVHYQLNSDAFVFDTEIIVQGVAKFMKIEEIPIRTRYFDEASSIRLWPSIVYGLEILKTMFMYFLHQKRIIRFKRFM